LSDSYLQDQLGGVLMQAQNSARRTVFGGAPEGGTLYASELLDGVTCIPCRDLDGTEFDTIESATESYPSGGYWECLGGARCRGTLIWTAPTESPASV
jgi:hypothetical protein